MLICTVKDCCTESMAMTYTDIVRIAFWMNNLLEKEDNSPILSR
jgi:hypothetical protein